MKTTLYCNKVFYIHDNKNLINNFNFNIKLSDSVLITGQNGIGKTTILKIIAGLIEPTSGTIQFNEKDIQDDYQYKKDTAYLGHKNAFSRELTVEQNLKFWASLRNTYELILPTIYYLNLLDIMHIQYSKLSAGWAKRIAFARLMISDAMIWILDEPFTNLDKETQSLLHSLLVTKVQHHGMLIMTSHEKIDMPNLHHIDLDKQ